MVSWFSTSKEEAVKFAKINAVDILLIEKRAKKKTMMEYSPQLKF
jgi:hypothetical protein